MKEKRVNHSLLPSAILCDYQGLIIPLPEGYVGVIKTWELDCLRRSLSSQNISQLDSKVSRLRNPYLDAFGDLMLFAAGCSCWGRYAALRWFKGEERGLDRKD
jgi:hypothetical protein